MGLGERLYELLTRVLSLRIIVIVAALSVVALVITLGLWVWFGVTNDQYSQLDRRLDSVSSLGDISTLLRSTQQAGTDEPVPNGGLVRTARIDGATVSIPRDVVLPKFDVGYANTNIDGVEYRVRTFAAGDAMIALGAPLAETQRRIDELHRRVLLICGGVIIGTVLVGWVMWSIMINPFRLLAQQARAINAQSNPDEVQVRGVQEAVEIAEAVEGMLARIGDEQQRTRAALESARDFAAVASHELRTPLTAMRTNLEVLSTLAMREDQRQEVIADVMRTQSRIEATLTALERLAQGELTTVDDFVPVDITETAGSSGSRCDAQLPESACVPCFFDHGADGGIARRSATRDRQRDHERDQARRCNRNPAQRREFRRRSRDRRRRQRRGRTRGRTIGGIRAVLPGVDGFSVRFGTRSGPGGPAGRSCTAARRPWRQARSAVRGWCCDYPRRVSTWRRRSGR